MALYINKKKFFMYILSVDLLALKNVRKIWQDIFIVINFDYKYHSLKLFF